MWVSGPYTWNTSRTKFQADTSIKRDSSRDTNSLQCKSPPWHPVQVSGSQSSTFSSPVTKTESTWAVCDGCHNYRSHISSIKSMASWSQMPPNSWARHVDTKSESCSPSRWMRRMTCDCSEIVNLSSGLYLVSKHIQGLPLGVPSSSADSAHVIFLCLHTFK